MDKSTDKQTQQENKAEKKDILQLWKGMPGKEKRLIITLLVVLLLGVVLIKTSGWDLGLGNNAVDADALPLPQSSTQSDKLEATLLGILTEIKGAGSVSIAIYYSESAEQVYARESETSTSQTNSEGSTSTSQQLGETLAIANDQPVSVKEYAARISGVVVVSSGAGDAVVKERLYQAVKSLLGLSADQIAIIEGEVK